MSRSREDELAAKIEELRRKVRTMPRGCDLGAFLDRECSEVARLLREDLAAERVDAASSEADFPPCAVPPLRKRKTVEPGAEETPGQDDPR
ncbi:hypothetical protein HQ520_08485 [bacterium]|nr:hypothetical protein [bacterium]